MEKYRIKEVIDGSGNSVFYVEQKQSKPGFFGLFSKQSWNIQTHPFGERVEGNGGKNKDMSGSPIVFNNKNDAEKWVRQHTFKPFVRYHYIKDENQNQPPKRGLFPTQN